MNRRQILAGGLSGWLIGFPTASNATLTAEHGFNDAEIDWRLFDEGREQALREGKPIFFLVHTTWCPHCARYREVFFEKEIVELISGFVPVLVDRDLQRKVSVQFAPDGDYIPRTMFLNSNAHLVGDLAYTQEKYKYFVDYRDPSFLRDYLSRAVAHFS